MLTEQFVAASSSPPSLTASSANSILLKDAGIFLHTHQPQSGLKATHKKSQSRPNCIAVTSSHVFAAQDGKAVVHIYSRVKGNHEASVPFPAKIRSLVITSQDTLIALGLEDGSLIFWELATGRIVQTPQHHLQPVTSLVVDPASNFLISGSADSTVHIWALSDILSLSTSALNSEEQQKPRYTLTSHRGGITALAVGHSHGTRNLLATGSGDKTISLWDHHTGAQLRTYLVPSTPQAITFDPADRAVFAAYDDGRVQVLDLLHEYPYASSKDTTPKPAQSSALSPQPSIIPIQPPLSTFFPSPTQDPDPAHCISLSYDATTLLTGHKSGTIRSWSVADHRFAGTIAEYPSAPITNIHFLPPTGFPKTPPDQETTYTKPKSHEPFSGPNGTLSGSYTHRIKLTGTKRLKPRIKSSLTRKINDFDRALFADGFPADMLSEALAYPSIPDLNGKEADLDADFLALPSEADMTAPKINGSGRTEADFEAEIKQLKAANAHLKKILSSAQEQRNSLLHAQRVEKRVEVQQEEEKAEVEEEDEDDDEDEEMGDADNVEEEDKDSAELEGESEENDDDVRGLTPRKNTKYSRSLRESGLSRTVREHR